MDMTMLLAVAGTVTALLLPGVVTQREASRQRQCQQNLRMLGQAMLDHHDKIGHLPTGGWGYRWVGDADGGTGEKQPGGWIYNILPYIGQEALHQLGAGLEPQAKRRANAQRAKVSLRLFNCPSRRQFQLYPCPDAYPQFYNADEVTEAAKSDYAACAGDRMHVTAGGPDSGTGPKLRPQAEHTGIGGPYSKIRLEDVTDGRSHTYMIGEKYLNADLYKSGLDRGDDLCMYVGFDNDIYRCTARGMFTDTPGLSESTGFGSPHPYGCQFVFCDGSLRNVSNAIDPEVHHCLGNRMDGRVADLSEYSHLIESEGP